MMHMYCIISIMSSIKTSIDSIYINVFKLDGVDFFYASRADARKFVEFLQSVVPCR